MGAIIFIGLIIFVIIKVVPEIEREQRLNKMIDKNWNDTADKFNKDFGGDYIKKH